MKNLVERRKLVVINLKHEFHDFIFVNHSIVIEVSILTMHPILGRMFPRLNHLLFFEPHQKNYVSSFCVCFLNYIIIFAYKFTILFFVKFLAHILLHCNGHLNIINNLSFCLGESQKTKTPTKIWN